jgi:hypothetical protein
VGAVEGVGDAEEGGDAAEALAVGVAEAGEGFVFEGGEFFAVVAGGLGDDFDFVGFQGAPRVAADDFGGVFVVAFAAGGDGPAGVMEEGGALEQGAVHGFKEMDRGEQVEEPEGEAGDLEGVGGVNFPCLHEGAGFADGGSGEVKIHGGCG